MWIGVPRAGARNLRMGMRLFRADPTQMRNDTHFSNPIGWGRMEQDPYMLCFDLTGFGPPPLMCDPGHTHVGSPVFEGRVMGPQGMRSSGGGQH